MICIAAHRAALAAVPKHEYRILKDDTTGRGKGAHQHPAMLLSHRRYQLRKAGVVEPLEYMPLNDALAALK
jgi:hypothetical protein